MVKHIKITPAASQVKDTRGNQKTIPRKKPTAARIPA